MRGSSPMNSEESKAENCMLVLNTFKCETDVTAPNSTQTPCLAARYDYKRPPSSSRAMSAMSEFCLAVFDTDFNIGLPRPEQKNSNEVHEL